jgi:hypothetical protein
MSTEREAVPDLMLERLALADLDPESAADVRSRLEAAGQTGRLGEIEASNTAILAAHPPAAVFEEVQRRMAQREVAASSTSRKGHRWLPWSSLLLSATAAAALVLVIRPTPKPGEDATRAAASEGREIITLKGLRPHLIIYKKTASGPARLTDKSPVHPGDTLQVAYVAAGRRFGVVVSQDARGSVTLHLPTGGSQAAELAAQGETAAANAFELDDSPGFERFVFVTSNEPFATSMALEALRSKDKPKLPAGVTISEIVLAKKER